MCCSCPDGAAAARQGNDSWLTHPAQAQDATDCMSTTFKAEGVQLPPQQLKELKAIATERDEQRKRAMGDEEWRSLLDHAQHLFSGLVHPSWASPFAVPHLSQAPHPCPLRDHPSKGLSGGPEEVHGGRNSAAPGLRNAATPSTSTMQVRCLQAGAAPLKWVASKWVSRRLVQDGT